MVGLRYQSYSTCHSTHTLITARSELTLGIVTRLNRQVPGVKIVVVDHSQFECYKVMSTTNDP